MTQHPRGAAAARRGPLAWGILGVRRRPVARGLAGLSHLSRPPFEQGKKHVLCRSSLAWPLLIACRCTFHITTARDPASPKRTSTAFSSQLFSNRSPVPSVSRLLFLILAVTSPGPQVRVPPIQPPPSSSLVLLRRTPRRPSSSPLAVSLFPNPRTSRTSSANEPQNLRGPLRPPGPRPGRRRSLQHRRRPAAASCVVAVKPPHPTGTPAPTCKAVP